MADVGRVTPETIEKAFAETPDAKAVLLVSPTYYGLCSDLSGDRRNLSLPQRSASCR